MTWGRPKPTWAVPIAFALALSSAYLALRSDPNPFYFANVALHPLSMDAEGAGPRSPFFPSSADTDSGKIIPANFFMTSATCGKCHKDIYDQWNASMHHFSSFNNQWYRKAI